MFLLATRTQRGNKSVPSRSEAKKGKKKKKKKKDRLGSSTHDGKRAHSSGEARGRWTKKKEDSCGGCVYEMNMVEIQQRGIEFLRSVQKVGTSYRALGLAERSSTDTPPRVPRR